MRNFAFAVVVMFVSVAHAQYTNHDDDAVRAFEQVDSAFQAAGDRQALYVDQKIVYAGNSATPVTVETRRNCGLYMSAGAGMNIMNGMTSPQVSLGLGYLWNWGFIDTQVSIFRAKPYKASEDQSKFWGASLEGTFGVKVLDWSEHHDQIFLTATGGYNRVKDFQNLGSYSAQSVEETPTQVITTTEEGQMDYAVNLSSLQFLGGVEYLHKFYNSPIHIGAYARAGVNAQLQKHNGVTYKPRFEAGVKVTYTFMQGHRVSKKAKDMIRY